MWVSLFFLFIFGHKFKINIVMSKREIIKIVIKVLIYALTLVGGYLGVTAMTSCSVQRDVSVKGHSVIISTDTTYIDHEGNLSVDYKTK